MTVHILHTFHLSLFKHAYTHRYTDFFNICTQCKKNLMQTEYTGALAGSRSQLKVCWCKKL